MPGITAETNQPETSPRAGHGEDIHWLSVTGARLDRPRSRLNRPGEGIEVSRETSGALASAEPITPSVGNTRSKPARGSRHDRRHARESSAVHGGTLPWQSTARHGAGRLRSGSVDAAGPRQAVAQVAGSGSSPPVLLISSRRSWGLHDRWSPASPSSPTAVVRWRQRRESNCVADGSRSRLVGTHGKVPRRSAGRLRLLSAAVSLPIWPDVPRTDLMR